jgi:phosphoglycerate dehydrogenase-like enzyme
MLRNGFASRVLINDIKPLDAFAAETGAEIRDLESLLREADVVSLHLPYDPSTAMIMNAERLALMSDTSILINTARGGLVDEAALADMLRDGRLAGAGFDVLAVEPPEDTALFAIPNFLVTPHIGGSAEEAIVAMGRAAIDGLDAHAIPEPGIFPPGRW